MERLFSKRIDVIRAAAGDDIDRKMLICCLLRFRRLFLWAALPQLLFLGAVGTVLLFYYIMMMRGKAAPAFFLKIIDIFSVYTAPLLVLTFTCLYLVKASDDKLKLLSSLRPDETDCADLVSNFPDPPEEEAEAPAERLPAGIATAEEGDNDEISTPSESDADTPLASSRFVYENAG